MAEPGPPPVDRDAEEPYIKDCLRAAEEYKLEGNNHFRSGLWDEALAAYKTGLAQLPTRKACTENLTDGPLGGSPNADAKGKSKEANEESSTSPPTELDLAYAKARSILYANIGACWVKLKDHQNAAEACTQALLDDPHYVKALERRAGANDTLNSWSSLTTVQEDYNTLLNILPPSSPQTERIQQALERLKPRIEAAQKREMEEMLGKLKGIGNNILGKFGLSTDNFKFKPNDEGGYSMNFSQ